MANESPSLGNYENTNIPPHTTHQRSASPENINSPPDKPTSFLNIPPEILCFIIPRLDPISLINLSQTSQFFRWFISPQPKHFVQRLLALELTPEYGGIIPLFRSRDNTITPPTDSHEWNSNKYACPGCMKILPHQMFDNHSILGLGLRKPPPGSEEAQKLTDWEPPGDEVARWKRIQRHAADERERLEPWRRRYALAVYSNGLPHNGFMAEPDTYAEDDALAEAAEKVLCGKSRHKRLCIECKRRRGFYHRDTRSNQGTAEMPFIKSRKILIKDELSRYFPHTTFHLPEQPSPRLFRVQRPDRRCFPVTNFISFCRHCSTWQQATSFRLERRWSGSFLPIVFPTSFARDRQQLYAANRWPMKEPTAREAGSDICCSHCLATQSIDQLTKELVLLFTNEADSVLEAIRSRLKFGWSYLCDDFYKRKGLLNQPKYARFKRQILGRKDDREQLKAAFDTSCDLAYGPIIDWEPKVYSLEQTDEEERRGLNRRIKVLRRFLDNECERTTRAAVLGGWMGDWLEDYEDNEDCLFYVFEVVGKVKSNPRLLVDYVLDPVRFRYPRPDHMPAQQPLANSEERNPGGPQTESKGAESEPPLYARKRRRWKIKPDPNNGGEEDVSDEDYDEFEEEDEELESRFCGMRFLKEWKGKGKA